MAKADLTAAEMRFEKHKENLTRVEAAFEQHKALAKRRARFPRKRSCNRHKTYERAQDADES